MLQSYVAIFKRHPERLLRAFVHTITSEIFNLLRLLAIWCELQLDFTEICVHLYKRNVLL